MIVTDALNMAGVADAYGAEAGVRAFLAGADLLLQPADPRAAIDAMERAVDRGEITPERLDRSVRRVLEAKRAPRASSPGARCRSTAFPPSWAARRSRRTRRRSPRARS